jgi:hypothetical protein
VYQELEEASHHPMEVLQHMAQLWAQMAEAESIYWALSSTWVVMIPRQVELALDVSPGPHRMEIACTPVAPSSRSYSKAPIEARQISLPRAPSQERISVRWIESPWLHSLSRVREVQDLCLLPSSCLCPLRLYRQSKCQIWRDRYSTLDSLAEEAHDTLVQVMAGLAELV